MHRNRNGGAQPSSTRQPVAPPPVDRVCGLGLCDVLRVEFEPCQIELLLDELDEQRRVFDEAIAAEGDEEELDALCYERDVIEMIARQVPQVGADAQRVIVCGPARIIRDLVRAAAADAAERLVDEMRTEPGRRDGGLALIAAARVAAAWAETHIAVEAIEDYNFDPASDPAGP